jgi:small-conductance mechanosensitive channel
MQTIIDKALQILDRTYLGNTVAVWALALGTFVVATLALRLIVRGVARRLGKISEAKGWKVLGLLGEILAKTSFLTIAFAGLLAGAQFLHLPPKFDQLLRSLLIVLGLLQGGIWVTMLLERWLQYKVSREKEGGRSTAVMLLSFTGKLLLWGFILLLSLENLGIDVTALIAGLGVGGIAVALATQNLLSDLLGSVAIALDKPFEVGDLIIVGELNGHVEHIGLKTTRVRSIYGEQIVFSNADLLGSRIRNYKRMSERRVVFTIGVEYSTPLEKLRALPSTIGEVISKVPDVRFERAYLRQFGESDLQIEVVFFVLNPDIGLYMERLHEINMGLFERLGAEGVDFAFPTREVILRQPLATV